MAEWHLNEQSTDSLCELNDRETQETDMKTVDELVSGMTISYSRYFAIDTSNEISMFDESIEEKLTHLEEFCGILDIVRQTNNSCLEQHLPLVLTKSLELQELYDSIDRLQDTVATIRKCVDDMEQQVTKAEQIFANTKLKKLLSSFWSNKRKSSGNRKPEYIEPNIFSVQQFIHVEDSKGDHINE